MDERKSLVLNGIDKLMSLPRAAVTKCIDHSVGLMISSFPTTLLQALLGTFLFIVPAGFLSGLY